MIRNYSILVVLTHFLFIFHVFSVSSASLLSRLVSYFAVLAIVLTYLAQRNVRLYKSNRDQRQLTKKDIKWYIRFITGMWYIIGMIAAFVPFWLDYNYKPLAYGVYLMYSCIIFVVLIVSNPLDFTRINKL